MSLSTPVAFLIFNRPDLTQIVFEAIAQVQPQKLLVIADGPRTDEEAQICHQARSVINQVDWNCKILKNYAETNLGCRQRVASGLDWVFSEVEEAIILEDDCLPASTFFSFCQTLLEYYRHDQRIMHISGNNFQDYQSRTPYSYFFSKYNHCWGWASWRRAWKFYDVNMKTWVESKTANLLDSIFQDEYEKSTWITIFDRVFHHELDTWDFQWTYACWMQAGLTILPDVNLISNLGFRADATHTKAENPLAKLPVGDISVITHPPFIVRHEEADRYTFEHIFGGIKFREIDNQQIASQLNRQEQQMSSAMFQIDPSQILRVDLGCGDSKPEGFIGVDLVSGVGVDIVADLTQTFPFPDDSVDEVRAHNSVEHWPDRIHTMNEIWRICKPGAKVDILVPSTDGRGAFQDPTHVSFWNINSFLYYCIEAPPYLELCKKYGFKGEFSLVKLEQIEMMNSVVYVVAELIAIKSGKTLNSGLSSEQGTCQESLQGEAINSQQHESHDLLNRLSVSLEYYWQDPNDQVAIATLRQIRRQIAQRWLDLPSDQLEQSYSGNLGTAYKMLVQSLFKREVLINSEQTLVEELTQLTTEGLVHPKSINYLLALGLYCQAYQLPTLYNPLQIPQWFLTDYLRFMLPSPPYFQAIGEAESYRYHAMRWIDYLHEQILTHTDSKFWQQVALDFTNNSYLVNLNFTDTNLKEILTKRADIIEYCLQFQGHELEHQFNDAILNRKKIKLGILAEHFINSSETFASLAVYEYISRDFEVILYSLYQTDHPLEQYCRSCANSFIKLPENLIDQVNTIRADDLDILFIATNVTLITNQICRLAMHRLARIQFTSVACVVTTGMPRIDYYLSSLLIDPLDEAQEHYRERLIKLTGLVHCFSYGPSFQKTSLEVNRENLGISEDRLVFISSANCFKITPELIRTWAKILAVVTNSILILLPFGPNWANTYPNKNFIKHLHATFLHYGIAPDRLIVLDPKPTPDREQVREYYQLADIYLDSYPFSGTTSLIEPLEVGLPIITRQGSFFRSVMGAAILKSLDLPDLVADSEEAYIQLAITLGTDPKLRQRKRDEIQHKMQNCPSFLDSHSYAKRMEELLKDLFNHYQSEAVRNCFRLRDINVVIFPDWSQSEAVLCEDLACVLRALLLSPEQHRITLLVYIDTISKEDAYLMLSGIVMNLMMEEDLEIAFEPEISLISSLNTEQWELLHPYLCGRMVINHENSKAITQLSANHLQILQSWASVLPSQISLM